VIALEKAVVYLRVSGRQQADDGKTGFQRQEEAVREYASKNNYQITATYRETYTGTEYTRPTFKQMVTDLLTDGVRTILVESFDRFSRETATGMQLVYYLAAREINLINCANDINVTEDVKGHPTQKFMVRMMAEIAELERDLSVYRLRKGRDIASERLGHRVEGPPSQYSREFRDTLKALHCSMSWNQVADFLNKQGETTCNDEPWTGPRASAVARGGAKAV